MVFILFWAPRLQPFAAPEDLPFGEHYARVVSGLFERLTRPIADGRERDHSPRRTHGPELFIEALAREQRLPLAPRFAPCRATAEPLCQAANKSEQSATGKRGRPHVVKRLFAADLKLPWFDPLLRDRRLQPSSVYVRGAAFRPRLAAIV
jgi:hypothetical protein